MSRLTGMRAVDDYLHAMAAADEAGDLREAHLCQDMAAIALIAKIADGPDSTAQAQASKFWAYITQYHEKVEAKW